MGAPDLVLATSEELWRQMQKHLGIHGEQHPPHGWQGFGMVSALFWDGFGVGLVWLRHCFGLFFALFYHRVPCSISETVQKTMPKPHHNKQNKTRRKQCKHHVAGNLFSMWFPRVLQLIPPLAIKGRARVPLVFAVPAHGFPCVLQLFFLKFPIRPQRPSRRSYPIPYHLPPSRNLLPCKIGGFLRKCAIFRPI